MDAKTIVRKGIEHWNAHDRAGFLAVYDENIVYVDQPTGKEFVGREEFGKACYDLWTDAYPDNELKDVIVFGEGDLVCFQGRFVGTNTDKPIDAPFVFIAEVSAVTPCRARGQGEARLALLRPPARLRAGGHSHGREALRAVGRRLGTGVRWNY